MNTNTLKTSLLCLLFASNFLLANAQKLADSQQGSSFTYIYQLTTEEARKVNHYSTVDSSYFHSVIDSFPTGEVYGKKLPFGHFLKAAAALNTQKLDYISVQPFDVQLLNDEAGAHLQVFDMQGNPINDALVRVEGKAFHFDKESQSYRRKKIPRSARFEVQVGEYTAFYSLLYREGKGKFIPGARRVVYSRPVSYLWKPLTYPIRLPIDGVRSIVRKRPMRSIYKSKLFFKKAADKIGCIFDKYHCEDLGQKYKGYLALNQPKYRPGDTVKLKAFLVNKEGKPLRRKIDIELGTNTDYMVKNLKPYRKGGYAYEFVLHDSLNLELDKNYSINLLRNPSQSYIKSSFKYEDYELKSVQLEVDAEEKQYKDRPFKISIKGTDENDLNLLDARLEVTAYHKQVESYLAQQTFLPDTLFYKELPLNPRGETEILIDEKRFPVANLSYSIIVRLLTSDNEVLTDVRPVQYYHKNEAFEVTLEQDSLLFTYTENGIRQAEKAVISAYLTEGQKEELGTFTTPVKLPVNPFFETYIIERPKDGLKSKLHLPTEASLLSLGGELSKDSLKIKVDNPRKLGFTYRIYRQNKEVARGFSDSLFVVDKSGKGDYFVFLRYLWGGKLKEEDRSLRFKDKQLNISVSQPKLIYPGQETEIEVQVTNQGGKPVRNVDLTAYGLTKKFDYTSPSLPSFSKKKSKHPTKIDYYKHKVNNYHINTQKGLNFDFFKQRWGLDSLEFYHFIYPQDKIFRHEYLAASSRTQFAPFIFSKGKAVEIVCISVDGVFVYLNAATNDRPYSFPVTPGEHDIEIRTQTGEFTCRLNFTKGNKTIFSFDQDSIPEGVRRNEYIAKLTKSEMETMSMYLMPYRGFYGNDIAYLESPTGIVSLESRRGGLEIAGPLFGDYTFHLIDSFSTTFNFEPRYEYAFQKNVIKMREREDLLASHHFYNGFSNGLPLADELMTKVQLLSKWADKNEVKPKKKLTYFGPTNTSPEAGKLLLNTRRFRETPLNILLFDQSVDKLLGVYPGNTRVLNQLEEGLYRLVFFFEADRYYSEDSIFIQKNGINYYEIIPSRPLRSDAFSQKVNELLEISGNKDPGIEKKGEIKELYKKHYKNTPSSFTGNIIKGLVMDENGPLPYANVFIKGTSVGTLTDLDGRFILKVPVQSQLEISYVGYSSQEINIGTQRYVEAVLGEGVILEEAVVTALAGKIAGVNRFSAVQSINIRGVASLQEKVEHLSVEEATALFGEEGKNGAVVIKQETGFDYRAANAIRQNFSDYAFWEPRLATDKEGKARFQVTFPDDVTNWDTHFLAMNGEKQSGSYHGQIKSYKPLMGKLAVPRFLNAGDSVALVGKVLNYSGDSLTLRSQFEVNGEPVFSREAFCTNVLLDTLSVEGKGDTMKVKYFLQKEDGYFDGELKAIPVLPLGIERSEGQFYTIENDSTWQLSANPDLKTVQLYVKSSQLQIIEDEIAHVGNYRYLCNEQLASKLKALLAAKRIAEFKNEKFKEEKNIVKAIQLLYEKRGEILWGWWQNASRSYWISLHVLEALVQAKELGYDIKLNMDDLAKISAELTWELQSPTGTTEQIRILQLLGLLEAPLDYAKYITDLEKTGELSSYQTLQVLAIKQAQNLPCTLDSLKLFKQETIFGNEYYSTNDQPEAAYYDLLYNDIQTTLLAYKILEKDSSTHAATLSKMRNFFLERRSDGYWRNTFESAQIIETILPDLLGEKKALIPTKLQLSGAINQTITEFPLALELTQAQVRNLTLSKTGDLPIYLSSYQRYWDPNPEIRKNDFEVETRFTTSPKGKLEAGQETTLVAELLVHKEAEYVMLNIPIPAGCTYSSKPQPYGETHREYFKNETTVYLQHLKPGRYTFEVPLVARYAGQFTLNPARVELMYFPVFQANDEVKRVTVE